MDQPCIDEKNYYQCKHYIPARIGRHWELIEDRCLHLSNTTFNHKGETVTTEKPSKLNDNLICLNYERGTKYCDSELCGEEYEEEKKQQKAATIHQQKNELKREQEDKKLKNRIKKIWNIANGKE